MTACPPKTTDELHTFAGKPSTAPPSLIFFEDEINLRGDIVTLEVVGCQRDGKDVNDITFYSFHHEVRGARTYVKFQYNDFCHEAAQHRYVLSVMFHIVA